MDKQQAIDELKEFREEYLISRDKLCEVYTFFKHNPQEEHYTCLVNNAPVKIRRKLFWDNISTHDIRKICQRNKDVETIELDYTTQDDTSDFNTKELSRLRKECVTAKNKLNFERNLFNKNLKEISSLEELNKELIEGLKKLKPIQVNSPQNVTQSGKNDDVLLVQLSDLHIQSITSEFREIQYDMNVANKRLKKFASYIKNEILKKDIKKVVIVTTGDMVNSDLIEPKKANQTCNKSVATIMCVLLLQNFILDIYSVCNNICISGVEGNEDRWGESFYTDDSLITNGSDFIILNMLDILFKDIEGIKFINGKYNEMVININGSNILFSHGVSYGKGKLNTEISKTISRYSDKGVNIRYVVFGHLHESLLSNFYMRSASLVGNDSYATNMLNLNSRASQNIAFIGKDGSISPVAVDLQNVKDEMYDISNEMKKFNISSATKSIYNDIIAEI